MKSKEVDNEFFEIMAGKSDEEIKEAFLKRDDYQDAAIEAINYEVEKRGVVFDLKDKKELAKRKASKLLCSKLDKDSALKNIKLSSNFFMFIGVLSTLIGFLSLEYRWLIIDGIVYIILALLLRTLKSRIVAILLLILAFYAMVLLLISKFGDGDGGGNIYMAVFYILTSFKAVQATFDYADFVEKHKVQTKENSIKSINM